MGSRCFEDDGTGFTTQSFESWDYEFGTINVLVLVDLDSQQASLQINGNCVDSWDWTGSLGGVNFYGASADDIYTIDNFSLCANNDLSICLGGY